MITDPEAMVSPTTPPATAANLMRVYLGTMTFGWKQTSSYVDLQLATEMIGKFVDSHLLGRDAAASPVAIHVDTARIYSGGNSETMTGEAVREISEKLQERGSDTLVKWRVGTKAHPSQPGGLSADGLVTQYDKSMQSMGSLPSPVAEYYLHQPDTKEDLIQTLRTASFFVEKGFVGAVGMSNYHADEVRRAFSLCSDPSNGISAKATPSVYQGLYNPLNRNVEDDLLPALRENGCVFIAYNPLAAGMLTGKHLSSENSLREPPKGRFKNNPNYLPRFYTDANFAATCIIRDAIVQYNDSLPPSGRPWTMVEVTYAWILRHSGLRPGDGILLGASSIVQLEENLQACRRAGAFAVSDSLGNVTYPGEDLPDEILIAMEEAWKYVKEHTEGRIYPYWRSYSADMPGAEELDQGASYSASKK